MHHIYNFFYRIMWCLFWFLGACGVVAHLENMQGRYDVRQVNLDVAILAVAGAGLLLIIKNFCAALSGAPKPKKPTLAVVKA